MGDRTLTPPKCIHVRFLHLGRIGVMRYVIGWIWRWHSQTHLSWKRVILSLLSVHGDSSLWSFIIGYGRSVCWHGSLMGIDGKRKQKRSHSKYNQLCLIHWNQCTELFTYTDFSLASLAWHFNFTIDWLRPHHWHAESIERKLYKDMHHIDCLWVQISCYLVIALLSR